MHSGDKQIKNANLRVKDLGKVFVASILRPAGSREGGFNYRPICAIPSATTRATSYEFPRWFMK